jgi:hypothetical protein
MRVYNLTGAQFAISNLALQRIKISRYRDLNDPFELLGVNLGNKKDRKAFRKTKEEIDRNQGIICFSKNWKNPLIWGHYAEKHTGIALGFDVPDDLLLSMVYKKKLTKIELNPKTGKPAKAFVDSLICTKFKDWVYEEEVRLTLQLDHDSVEAGMYFEPFSLKLQLREVVLGPKCELPTKRIRKLVADYNPTVTVIKSRIAFTRFEVLENKTATRIDKEA